jgi:ATP-binding cassette subfamily B protein
MRNLRRIFCLIRPYRRPAVLALLVLAGLVVTDLAIPRLLQHLVDHGMAKRDRAVVVWTVCAMVGTTALGTLLAVANTFLSVRVAESVARDLRAALFQRIERFSYSEHDRQTTSGLLVRLTSDVSAVKSLIQISLRIGTRAPLLMLGSMGLMVATSARLALTLLPLLLVTALVIALFVSRMEPLARLRQQQLEAVQHVFHENIAGARVVKSFARGEHEAARFDAANGALTQRSIEVMRSMAALSPALTMCINLGVVLVISLGGRRAIADELSIGQVVAFTNYLLTTMAPLIMVAMLSNVWAAGFASLRRVAELLDGEPQRPSAADALAVSLAAPAQVRFEDVSFTYPGAHGEPVLKGVSLSAFAGETVAIVGATGAGKSTLLSLIPRFYQPTAGRVSAFGHDVRALAQRSLLTHVAIVAQEPMLFSGSVRDNIRYGRPAASEREVERAARAAQAHEFIARMAEGYDSRVEQGGGNLSGGQKQRIALARALLLEPKILLLDDSTSAVDVATESAIRAALWETRHSRTTFVVTQRIASALEADRIVVLERGRIVAEGAHHDLLRTCDVYREICESQRGDGIVMERARELERELEAS